MSPICRTHPARALTYRLLGHEHVPLTGDQLEGMVRDGLLSADTKVRGDGEGFAAALGSRAEFRHLVAGHPISSARPDR